MAGKDTQKVSELCELAAKEQDPEKLHALVEEIDRLLQEKEERIGKHHFPSDSIPPPKSPRP